MYTQLQHVSGQIFEYGFFFFGVYALTHLDKDVYFFEAF